MLVLMSQEKNENREMNMAERLLTANEVAQRLNFAKGSIYNLVSQKKLPAIRIFGALRFDPSEIRKLIEQGRTQAREQKVEAE